MSQKPLQTMIRLPRPLVERLTTWGKLTGLSNAKVIELAVNYWEKQTPFEPFGLPPRSDDNAPNKAND